MHLPQPQRIQHPLILRIPIPILVRPQRMRHALHRIHDGARKVVRRVHLPLIPRPMVWLCVRAIDDGVPQRLVRIVHAHLGADAPAQSRGFSRGHLRESGEVVWDRRVSPFGGDAVHPLLPHLHLLGVVGVRLPAFDHLHAVVVQFLEVIGRMGMYVAVDAHQFEVF